MDEQKTEPTADAQEAATGGAPAPEAVDATEAGPATENEQPSVTQDSGDTEKQPEGQEAEAAEVPESVEPAGETAESSEEFGAAEHPGADSAIVVDEPQPEAAVHVEPIEAPGVPVEQPSPRRWPNTPVRLSPADDRRAREAFNAAERRKLGI